MASCWVAPHLVPSHSHCSTCGRKQSCSYHHSNRYQFPTQSHLRSCKIITPQSRRHHCSKHFSRNIHPSLDQSSLLSHAIQQHRSLQHRFFSHHHLHLNLHCCQNPCQIIFSKWVWKYINWVEFNSLHEIFHCLSYSFSIIHTFQQLN